MIPSPRGPSPPAFFKLVFAYLDGLHERHLDDALSQLAACSGPWHRHAERVLAYMRRSDTETLNSWLEMNARLFDQLDRKRAAELRRRIKPDLVLEAYAESVPGVRRKRRKAA